MTRRRPNILWYCTDQQRYDTIGALGYPAVSTPHVDALVARGAAFTRAYSQSPICTPSRASFLTGRYPNAVRSARNGAAWFADTHPLVTRLLADAGYDCGLVGKLHLASAFGRAEPRVNDGYRYFKYSHAPRDDWKEGHDYADWVRERGAVLGELTQSLDGVPAPLHQTTWATDRAIEFVRQPRAGPWMLSVNVYDPHPPFNPPRSYRERFDPKRMPDPLFRESDLAHQQRLSAIDFQSRPARPQELDIEDPILPRSPLAGYRYGERTPGARDAWTLKAAYYAMIELIDDQFGRLLAALDACGQAEDTLVVFSTDHGESLGDHGLIEKGCRFYEGLVHVPLVVAWPGVVRPGLVSAALVELMDLAPTLLDAAGVAVPEHMQGRSLLPLLMGEADPSRHKTHVRSEYFDAILMSDASRATMYFDGRYKLVVYHGHGIGELFDLVSDPGEFDSLWDRPEARDLRAELTWKSFDASMLAEDLGPPRMGPM